MSAFFTPPPGYSPAKLGAYAVLGFAIAGVALPPTLDRDFGIKDPAALSQAHGKLARLNPERNGVTFVLQGRAETFEYPSKAGGRAIVESALGAAGDKEVAVSFDPEPREPMFSSKRYYNAWEIAIDGIAVRTTADAKESWRSNNAVAAWICAGSFLFGLYMALLAVRTHRAREFN